MDKKQRILFMGTPDYATIIFQELLENNYKEISAQELFYDYKTTLQEVTQAKFGAIPEYKVESTKGPDHDKVFTLSLFINGKQYSTAEGKSKKLAQQANAKIVLKQLTGKTYE